MNVIVCGGRKWRDYATILRRLGELPADTEMWTGGCRGADCLAERAASELGFTVHVVPALWGEYGIGGKGDPAGPIRNQHMLELAVPDLVLAFHNDYERSRGTRDMVDRARKAGVPVEIICSD